MTNNWNGVMSEQVLRRAVLKQIQSSRHVQQQIAKQVGMVLTTGKASGKIRVRIPIPTEDVSKPVFRANENRDKRRFVLNGTPKQSKGLLK